MTSFITDLRKINLQQDENKIIEQVSPIVRKAINNAHTWFQDDFYEVDIEQGFGSHLLFENPDHTLAVIVTAWPHGRETPPHDHDTWAVIGCIHGVEKNTLWQRDDDGARENFAKISKKKTVFCRPGDIVTMNTTDIHSVMNPESGVSVSLHIYGKHFNHTNRHQFDPIHNTVRPFIVRQKIAETI